MKSQKYRCKDKPNDEFEIVMPYHIELPAQVRVRYPDEDFREYVFWSDGKPVYH